MNASAAERDRSECMPELMREHEQRLDEESGQDPDWSGTSTQRSCPLAIAAKANPAPNTISTTSNAPSFRLITCLVGTRLPALKLGEAACRRPPGCSDA
jgi:hypothetical protein